MGPDDPGMKHEGSAGQSTHSTGTMRVGSISAPDVPRDGLKFYWHFRSPTVITSARVAELRYCSFHQGKLNVKLKCTCIGHVDSNNGERTRVWNDTRILQHASRSMELVVKEAICIRTAPESSHFNRDGGYDIPDCWIATYRKLKSGTRAGRSGRSHRNGHCAGPTPAN